MKIWQICISVALFGAAVAFLALNQDLSALVSALRQLPPTSIAIAFVALLANALFATFRFKTVAADVERPVSFREAMAAVSAGSLGGAAFFQIAGQLIARGIVAGRNGMSFASVVAITAYERIVAAICSGLIALGGAYFIFGKIYLDQQAGGAVLIKIVCGLIAAAAAGALLGYGRFAARSMTPALARHFIRTGLRTGASTLLVQFSMMGAYVALAHALSPATPIVDLLAAAAIVMFAASVPISLAGWGIREMSAVLALGQIGVAGYAAFATAFLIGFGSLAVMGLLSALSLPNAKQQPREMMPALPVSGIDYSKVLIWALPLAAATLVLFQLHVPTSGGLINVNLADPVVIIGGALFLLHAVHHKQWPHWRVAHMNLALAVTTLAIGASLIIGVWRFGWTEWAWLNRFIGWFVLLAYAATGALIVQAGRSDAFRIMLLTFVGAAAAVAAIDCILILLRSAGFDSLDVIVVPGQAEGFAQNRNSFAFQLLMATSAILVLVRTGRLRIFLMTVILAGLWYSGSRSGWISAVALLGIAVYLRLLSPRELLKTTLFTCATVLLAGAISLTLGTSTTTAMPQIALSDTSTAERTLSMILGLKLFAENPIFGAGLGAFRLLMNPPGHSTALVIHSSPIWLLAELGITGFLVFVVPAIYAFVTQWRSARYDSASAVIVLCFVVMALMSAPADMLFQRTFWLLIGAAFAAVSADNAFSLETKRAEAASSHPTIRTAKEHEKLAEPVGD